MIADNHFSIFIITYKSRLAAAAAIIGGVRCHHWQRPLPIMSPPAANLKSMPLFPLRCLPLPVCRAPPLLNAPHRLRFASFKNCIRTVGTAPKSVRVCQAVCGRTQGPPLLMTPLCRICRPTAKNTKFNDYPHVPDRRSALASGRSLPLLAVLC